jgi:hypothetical protein
MKKLLDDEVPGSMLSEAGRESHEWAGIGSPKYRRELP